MWHQVKLKNKQQIHFKLDISHALGNSFTIVLMSSLVHMLSVLLFKINFTP